MKALGLLAIILSTSSLLAGEVLLKADFNESGGVSDGLLRNKHITLAEDKGPDGSNCIHVAYVGYERGSHRVTGRFPLSKGVTEATLTFDVMFEEDFQWVKGGKLHGLGPKHSITGGNERRPDGWSARMMWKQDGKLGTYLYDQDPKSKWGVGKTGARAFRAGKWHKVIYKVKLNDPGKKNGVVSIEVDRKRITSSRAIELRGVDGDHTLINHFLFSTFHGGHDPSWAPKDKKGGYVTVHAWFDNIVVTEGID